MSICELLDVNQLGELINKSYKTFIMGNYENLSLGFKDIETIDGIDDLEPIYLYLSIDKSNLLVEYEDLCYSDYFNGVSLTEKWVIAIMVDSNTNLPTLLEIDASEESQFYEDYKTIIKMKSIDSFTYYIQSNKIEKITFHNEYIEIGYRRDYLSQLLSVFEITYSCFDTIKNQLPFFSSTILLSH